MAQTPNDRTLVYLVMHVSKLLEDCVRARMSDIGVHRGQGHALQVLRRQDDISQTELMEKMGVAAPTVTGILKRMESAGLIRRERQPDDSRTVRVRLTAKGRKLADAAAQVLLEVEEALIAEMSARELSQAHRLLQRLRENLGGPASEHAGK